MSVSTSPTAPDRTLLSERRRAILKIIVQEHIATARPVASETIARCYALGVSPATIRNEMAALEEMGYIHQLHTSAGRAPSERGYRFYVEHLMEEPMLAAEEQRTIAHQFHQAHPELGQWLRLAAAVLAQSAHNAALVTAPRAQKTRFKHLELIALQESLALLVAVFDAGTVRQQMFVPALPVTQDDLSAAAARVNRVLEGRTSSDLVDLVVPEGTPLEAQVLELVVRMMRELDERACADVVVDGLAQILSQPEFSTPPRGGQTDATTALRVLQLVQQGMLFKELIKQISNADGLQIIIGGLGNREEMRQVSIVLSRYGSSAIGGLLGVLGPTRMHYGRAVSVVRYVSGILSEMATELGGHQ
jgi:heat-inducible transcriptional repressor